MAESSHEEPEDRKPLVRDGLVAVLVSPEFGAGWSTWNDPELALNKRLALAVLGESDEDPEKVAAEEYPKAYRGGVKDLVVEWVTEGTRYMIEEYDGSESLVPEHSAPWSVA